MKIDITALFTCIDDFCKLYEACVHARALPLLKKRLRGGYLSLSEMLLIEVLYHFSRRLQTFIAMGFAKNIVLISSKCPAMSVLWP